jgi:hypothetical protein
LDGPLVLPLNAYFDGLLTNINPPADRQALAKNLPDLVRDHLVQSALLDTVSAPTTHLAGSYARWTTTDDIKDVDVLVFVDPGYEGAEPAVVLEALAAALADLEVPGYGKGTIRLRHKQRRSVHVEFKHSDTDEPSFHIDVVPSSAAKTRLVCSASPIASGSAGTTRSRSATPSR